MTDSAYTVERFGEQYRVIDRETQLILRTLDTREEMATFMNQLEPPKPKEK